MNGIGPQEFLSQALGKPIIDVRSPAEFNQAHITGAINLPLFTDDERAVSREPVTITQGLTVINGSGLEANNGTGITVISGRVNGIIYRTQ